MDQQKIKLYELISDDLQLNIKNKSKQETKQFKNHCFNSFVFMTLIFFMFYIIDFFVNKNLMSNSNIDYRMIFIILLLLMIFKFISHCSNVLDGIFTLSLSKFLPNKQETKVLIFNDSLEKCFYYYNRQQLIDKLTILKNKS